ncbi:MAG: ATP-binding cassette domain-containing protein, partial [Thermoplasmata archaeon]
MKTFETLTVIINIPAIISGSGQPPAEMERRYVRAVVQARNVHKIYEAGKIRVHALKGVSLENQRGEMVSIMRPSCCGKTTLLNCFSDLDEIFEGEVKIDCISLSGMTDDAKTE